MDYLDLKKESRHRITLMIGYVLIALAITGTALVLLNRASGVGISKGQIILNGLTFFSSHPHPADIYIDGKLKSERTNTRLYLPEGIYDVTLARDGYHDWQRKVIVLGRAVEHFDYPFLFPKELSIKKLRAYQTAPGLFSQSPDRRWLVLQPPGPLTALEVYDLKSPAKPPVALNLPDGILSKATGSESWQLGEWADDNTHLLLQHLFDGKAEYVMVDRGDPAKSLNLTSSLQLKAGQLALNNRKYDRYYIYDPTTKNLQSAALNAAGTKPVLDHVLAFKTYGDKTILYVTDNKLPAGKVAVRLTDGDKTWNIRNLPAGNSYLVDLTKYDGLMYVAAGTVPDGRVYIYQDPAGQIDTKPGAAAIPAQLLRVEAANYLSFSDNAQYIVAENGNHFAVYDILNRQSHNYLTSAPLDPPQLHASWMDGNRLLYVSSGKLEVFDYDNLNHHSLVAASSSFLPAFTPNYNFLYSLAPAANGQFELLQTSLLTAQDR